MQTLIDGILEETKPCAGGRHTGTLGSPTLDELEQRYQCARLRLLAAQEEKSWATSEFVAARAALHRTLEAIWPDPSER